MVFICLFFFFHAHLRYVSQFKKQAKYELNKGLFSNKIGCFLLSLNCLLLFTTFTILISNAKKYIVTHIYNIPSKLGIYV